MSFLKAILLISIFINMGNVNAQNMESHTWKNRVLLVITHDLNNTDYKNQIKELQACKSGLLDRKLIIYQITKTAYMIGLSETSKWQKSSQVYKEYQKANAPFQVILIGLDGGIKLRETDFISCEALFRVIDVMPMRKSELNAR